MLLVNSHPLLLKNRSITCRAAEGLREDWRQQLRELQREISSKYASMTCFMIPLSISDCRNIEKDCREMGKTNHRQTLYYVTAGEALCGVYGHGPVP